MGNERFVRITGYCVKCERRTDMLDIKVSKIKTTKGIRRISKGKCITCGSGMTKIMPTK